MRRTGQFAAKLISLAPGFNQVVAGGLLISEPFYWLEMKPLKTVHAQSPVPGHRTEVRC
jgi:hypothetical protein